MMIRTLAFCSLVALLTGCTRYHSRAQGPFAKSESPTLPGANVPKPLGNQPSLGIAAADTPRSVALDERQLVPPRTDSLAPAAGSTPSEGDADAGAFPPFRKRPDPKSMPSPFAPKQPNTEIAPSTPTPAAKSLAELKAVVTTANTAWKAVDTFEATVTRREINPQGAQTSEVVLFQFRREPMSVFTRTIGENGKGREMLYNPKKHDDKLYLMLGQGDHKLFKAGFIVPPVSPDDPRVKEKARNSIRDAGFEKALTRLADTVTKIEAGKVPADALVLHGPVKRDEYPYPLTAVTQQFRAGDDPLFPKGGSRTYFFDLKEKSPSYGLPVLIVAADSMGKEAEYYLLEKVKLPANLTDADFNPDRLGKK